MLFSTVLAVQILAVGSKATIFVVNETGQPIGGADIHVEQQDGTEVASGATKANGTFAVQLDPVWKGVFIIVTTGNKAEAKRVLWQSQPPPTIQIKVRKKKIERTSTDPWVGTTSTRPAAVPQFQIAPSLHGAVGVGTAYQVGYYWDHCACGWRMVLIPVVQQVPTGSCLPCRPCGEVILSHGP